MTAPAARPAACARETFTCCETPMPWPTRIEDRTCPECGTVWEYDGVDLGAGARIKPELAPEAGLAAPSPHGICGPADLDLVRQALADASAWRAWKAERASCGDCGRLGPGRCADHAADDELAAAYQALLGRVAVLGRSS